MPEHTERQRRTVKWDVECLNTQRRNKGGKQNSMCRMPERRKGKVNSKMKCQERLNTQKLKSVVSRTSEHTEMKISEEQRETETVRTHKEGKSNSEVGSKHKNTIGKFSG